MLLIAYLTGFIALTLYRVANGLNPTWRAFLWPYSAIREVVRYAGAVILVLKAGRDADEAFHVEH